ncbi:A-kinase anchor protein 200-like [Vespa mandarinia]|uniref:A-kinase anchor protein 200-like n=1 Tax=Vespa mandarinia TaxID=7446 RepID=UPI00161C8E4A|nr:A-kinase anchor protein 200-like [Vespa mandarinia]
MGARQSKRSVDITTTPKKEGIPSEGAVVGDAATPGDGKLERIEESDAKPTTNGIAYRTDVTEDKDKDKDEATEKDKEKQESEEVKSEDTKQESSGEPSAEGAEVTTPTEGNPASPNTVASPDSKEPKKKDKMRKKWSLRSISFSKKDKSKPTREETPKNGDVTKEEPLAEGGEDGEHAASSSAEDKSAVSSPSENETSSTPLTSAVEATEESGAASATTTTTTTTTTASTAAAATTPETAAPTTATTTPPATSPVAEEKKEEPTPSAPTPVPLEDKKEEVEKVEAEKKVVEVSPDGGQSLADSIKVSVFRVQPVDTPSIIERKTSEDLPSQLPSSPPPTPIEPSPLQQAQQAAATAVTVTALAKALELPVEPVVDKDVTTEVNSTLPTILHQDPLEDVPELSLSARVSNNDPLEQSSPILSNLESTTIEKIIIPVDVDSALLLTKDEPVGIVNKTDETVPILTEPDKTNFHSKLETVKTDSKMLENEATNVEDISKCTSDNIIEDIKTTEKLETNVTKVETTQENVEIVSKPEKVPDEQAPDEQANKFIEDAKEVIIETPSCKEDIIKEDNKIIILEDVEDDSNPSNVISNPEGTCNEHIIVEAKPAVVIPCEEVEEEVAEIIEEMVAEVKTTDSVEVIEPNEEKIEAEPILSDTTLPVKDLLVEEMNKLDVSSIPEDVDVELVDQSITEKITVVEKLADEEKNIIEIAEVNSCSVSLPISETKEFLDELIPEQPHLLPPPPPPPSSLTSTTITEVASNEQLSEVQANESLKDLTNANELFLSSQKDTIVTTNVPTERQSPSHTTITRITTPPPSPPSSSPTPPPPPSSSSISTKEEDTSCRLQSESSEFPLPPPNELTTKSPPSSPRCNVSQTSSNITEIVQSSITSPSPSPSNRSSTSIVSSTTTATNDCSQTLLHDDQTDRDLKTESVSQSLNSYNDSEVELKERLAQSLAETENQKETLSCRSLNDDVSTAFQENHQSTPEIENPVVEKTTVTNEVGTTESNVEEAPKVAPPAIPIEVPASPPSAPAITEDVASVTKAIEEIDISDKAVAAAVNEAIECNTNEIIADAHHQNNMNE